MWFFNRKKKMGGTNESVLKSDDITNGNKVLEADVPIPLPLTTNVPTQTQSIRQHMSNGQVHLHVDDDKLKVAIPVAEWFLILRNLRSVNAYTFVDTENNCIANLRPYILNGLFEVTIELNPIVIGPRFTSMNTVTGKK